ALKITRGDERRVVTAHVVWEEHDFPRRERCEALHLAALDDRLERVPFEQKFAIEDFGAHANLTILGCDNVEHVHGVEARLKALEDTRADLGIAQEGAGSPEAVEERPDCFSYARVPGLVGR